MQARGPSVTVLTRELSTRQARLSGQSPRRRADGTEAETRQEPKSGADGSTPEMRLGSGPATGAPNPHLGTAGARRSLTRSHRPLTWGARTPGKNSCLGAFQAQLPLPPAPRRGVPQTGRAARALSTREGTLGRRVQAGGRQGQEGQPRGTGFFLENTPPRRERETRKWEPRETGTDHAQRRTCAGPRADDAQKPHTGSEQAGGTWCLQGPLEFPRPGELQGAVSSSVY